MNQLEGEQRDAAPDDAGTDPNQDALDHSERDQPAPRCPARPEQGQFPPVTLDGSERRQICEPERDECAGEGQHDVERLGVEGVSRRGVEAVRQVVHEASASRQSAFDAVVKPGRLRERVSRTAA